VVHDILPVGGVRTVPAGVPALAGWTAREKMQESSGEIGPSESDSTGGYDLGTSEDNGGLFSAIPARAFAESAVVLLLLFGIFLRLRIHLSTPLPSDDPVLWLATGSAEDLAVLALAGALAVVFARGGKAASALARGLFGLFALLVGVAFALWTEAVIYFGHSPRRQDLQIASDVSFIRFSADVWLIARLSAEILVLGALLVWAARSSLHSRAASASPRRLLILGSAGLIFSALPLHVHLVETSRNPVFELAALAREKPIESPAEGSARPRPNLARTSVRELAPARLAREYFDERFPLAYRAPARSATAPVLPAGLRPNIVFLVMEGVRAHEIGAFGGDIAGLTPSLDKLAREGIAVERVYSPGTHTPEGELAIWYGLLAVPGEQLLARHPLTRLTGLPELLRAAGWRSFLWIHNSDQTFFGEDRFFQPRHFQTLDGRDFDKSDPRTNWGYSDKALARRAVTALDRLEEPFAAMVLTISNHHPFQLPPDAGSAFPVAVSEQAGSFPLPGTNLLVGRHTAQMLKTMHYTDEAVGDFFRLSRSHSWFARTLFIVASDHGLPIAPLQRTVSVHEFSELRHRVPLIFSSPLLAGGRRIDGPASLADIPPTLLGLLGISAPRAGVGCDILDPTDCGPGRFVFSWDDEGERITVATARRIYHAHVLAGGASEPEVFEDEMLIDPVADPRGKLDLKQSDPQSLAMLRRGARVYLEVYPWVVAEGRSGTPPSGATSGLR